MYVYETRAYYTRTKNRPPPPHPTTTTTTIEMNDEFRVERTNYSLNDLQSCQNSGKVILFSLTRETYKQMPTEIPHTSALKVFKPPQVLKSNTAAVLLI